MKLDTEIEETEVHLLRLRNMATLFGLEGRDATEVSLEIVNTETKLIGLLDRQVLILQTEARYNAARTVRDKCSVLGIDIDVVLADLQKDNNESQR